MRSLNSYIQEANDKSLIKKIKDSILNYKNINKFKYKDEFEDADIIESSVDEGIKDLATGKTAQLCVSKLVSALLDDQTTWKGKAFNIVDTIIDNVENNNEQYLELIFDMLGEKWPKIFNAEKLKNDQTIKNVVKKTLLKCRDLVQKLKTAA